MEKAGRGVDLGHYYWNKLSAVPAGDSTLQWRHNGCDSVSNHQSHDCFLNRLFRRTSKKTSKLRITGLCAWNSPVAGEFPGQMASNAENVSIWWRQHDKKFFPRMVFCGRSSLIQMRTSLWKKTSPNIKRWWPNSRMECIRVSSGARVK